MIFNLVGTITFGPGETSKAITLEVIDDDVFEEDEHFYVRYFVKLYHFDCIKI